MRSIIKNAAQEAVETISYSMPAFKLSCMLVYFAAYENHIGIYPTPSAIAAFKKELFVYKSAKCSAQFPLDIPLPVKLIGRIVEFRVTENLQKALLKKK